MGAPRNCHPKCFHFKGTCGSSRWVYLLFLTLGSISSSAHWTAHCLDHLCWIISTRRQDLIIPSILWNTFYIFNSFEYMSSNLHLMLSSLTTLTTSPTQFIRNPLGTITRVPAYFQLLLLRSCPLQLQPTFSGVVGALNLVLRKSSEKYICSG